MHESTDIDRIIMWVRRDSNSHSWLLCRALHVHGPEQWGSCLTPRELCIIIGGGWEYNEMYLSKSRFE